LAEHSPLRERNNVKIMKSQKKSKAPARSQDIDESTKLVGQVAKAFGSVQRLTPKGRIRVLKLRRGAHQVIPQITAVATKFGLALPTVTTDAIHASLAHAQALQPLLAAVSALHQTLIDAHLSAQSDAWKSATVMYSMLRNASTADPNIANELAPVTEWFRRRSKKSAAATTPETTAAPAAAASTSPATATTSALAPAAATASTIAPAIAH
jgi:hypothetical protein